MSIKTHIQSQLASSRVGVPQVDRSGQIIADVISDTINVGASIILNQKERKKDAEDSIAINSSVESRDIAKQQINSFMLENPDPSTWEAGTTNILNLQQGVFDKQIFSPKVSRDEVHAQKSFQRETKAGVSIAVTEQTVKNDVTISGKNLIGIAGDPLSKEEDIKKQTNLYREALSRQPGATPELVDVQIAETLKEGEDERKTNANRMARNLAADDPDGFIQLMNLIDEGVTEDSRFLSLTSSDREALRDYALSVGTSKEAADKKAGELSISNTEIVFSETFDTFDTNPNASSVLLKQIEDWDLTLLPDSVKSDGVKTKERWRKIATQAQVNSENRNDNTEALVRQEDNLIEVRRGSISREKAIVNLNNDILNLSTETYKSKLEAITRDFRASQNNAIANNRPIMKSILFPGGEESIFSLQKEIKIAKAAGNTDTVNVLTMQEDFQKLRRWNDAEGQKELDDFVQSNPNATKDEIDAEQKRVTAARDISFTQLQENYESRFKGTPKSLLIRPPVLGIENEWESASDKRKMEINNLTAGGVPADIIRQKVKEPEIKVSGKTLSRAIAEQIFVEAGKDPVKARQLAKERGFNVQ